MSLPFTRYVDAHARGFPHLLTNMTTYRALKATTEGAEVSLFEALLNINRKYEEVQDLTIPATRDIQTFSSMHSVRILPIHNTSILERLIITYRRPSFLRSKVIFRSLLRNSSIFGPLLRM